MYVTHRYLGIKKGDRKYLFLLLTEEYIQENAKIRDNLHPAIERFARELEHHGAVVTSFLGTEEDNLRDIKEKFLEIKGRQ